MIMSKQNILISTIIPSYNRANTVGETIESIVNQNGIGEKYDLEVVIGDDCSTDNAREVLLQYQAKYPNLIKLIFHEQNVGLGTNWGACDLACQGKYICNCDNDDYWHNPDKLLLQLEYMETHPNANVLFTDYRDKYRDTGRIVEKQSYIEPNDDMQKVVWGSRKSGWSNATAMYRADFMKQHIDFETWNSRHFTLQDWNAWLILAAYTQFDVLHVSTATMCVENVSITRPKSVESYAKRLNGDKDVCRYLGELFPEKFPFNEEDWNRYAVGRLIAKAFDVNDFEAANRLSQHPSSSNSRFKLYCASHKWAFHLFRNSRAIKRWFHDKMVDMRGRE